MRILQTFFRKKEIILLLFIIFVAAFLRLVNISQYMEFLGDEGRDVLVAKGILHGQFTLLGPRSSAGDFYMGPFYYYLITPFLLLFNYDPVGPAVMVALIGTATVLLIYLVGKKFFGFAAGIFASALYAVSPLVLAYSHSSWNPDILPFFALLFIYTIYIAVKKSKSWKYFFLSGFLLGICLQLHYLSLFLAATIMVYLFLVDLFKHKKIKIFILLKNYFLIFSGSIVSLSPFILFEFRHDFLNSKGILNFIFGNSVSYTTNANFFQIVWDVFFRLFSRLIVDFPSPARAENFPQLLLLVWGLSAVILAVFSIIYLVKEKNKYISLLLGLWLFLSIFLFGFYKKEIYDYLFTFIFPLPFLLVGNLFSKIYYFAKNEKKYKMLFRVLSLTVYCVIIVICLLDNPHRYEPNKQRDQTKVIAQFVISKSDNKPYNFALLSKGNSDFAYRYYLDILGRPPVILDNLEKDPARKSAMQQLLIVCEDVNCNPIGNPLHDVAAFGQAEIAGKWDVSVVKIFKLVPYKPSK